MVEILEIILLERKRIMIGEKNVSNKAIRTQNYGSSRIDKILIKKNSAKNISIRNPPKQYVSDIIENY